MTEFERSLTKDGVMSVTRKPATGLEELGILRQPGPREHRSLHAAQAIFDNIAEIERLAGEQGTLYQDDRVERYEWCRLVAMVIEVYIKPTTLE